jgi:hypothetical protein
LARRPFRAGEDAIYCERGVTTMPTSPLERIGGSHISEVAHRLRRNCSKCGRYSTLRRSGPAQTVSRTRREDFVERRVSRGCPIRRRSTDVRQENGARVPRPPLSIWREPNTRLRRHRALQLLQPQALGDLHRWRRKLALRLVVRSNDRVERPTTRARRRYALSGKHGRSLCDSKRPSASRRHPATAPRHSRSSPASTPGTPRHRRLRAAPRSGPWDAPSSSSRAPPRA